MPRTSARFLREKLEIVRISLDTKSRPELIDRLFPADLYNAETIEKYRSRMDKWFQGRSSTADDELFKRIAAVLAIKAHPTALMEASVRTFFDELPAHLAQKFPRGEIARLIATDDVKNFLADPSQVAQLQKAEATLRGDYVCFQIGRALEGERPVIHVNRFTINGIDVPNGCLSATWLGHNITGHNLPGYLYLYQHGLFLIIAGGENEYPPNCFTFSRPPNDLPVQYLFGIETGTVNLGHTTFPVGNRVLFTRVVTAPRSLPRSIPEKWPIFPKLFALLKNDVPNKDGRFKLYADFQPERIYSFLSSPVFSNLLSGRGAKPGPARRTS